MSKKKGTTYKYPHHPLSKAVWDIVLTPDEIKQLSEGADPRMIQPDHLLEYYPFWLAKEVR